MGSLPPCTAAIEVQRADQRLSYVGVICHHPCLTGRLAQVYGDVVHCVSLSLVPCFRFWQRSALEVAQYDQEKVSTSTSFLQRDWWCHDQLRSHLPDCSGFRFLLALHAAIAYIIHPPSLQLLQTVCSEMWMYAVDLFVACV